MKSSLAPLAVTGSITLGVLSGCDTASRSINPNNILITSSIGKQTAEKAYTLVRTDGSVCTSPNTGELVTPRINPSTEDTAPQMDQGILDPERGPFVVRVTPDGKYTIVLDNKGRLVLRQINQAGNGTKVAHHVDTQGKGLSC